MKLEEGRTDGYLALAGDTVITRQGHVEGWVGKKVSRVIRDPLIAASTLLVLRPRSQIDPTFLNFWLSSAETRAAIAHAHSERTSASLPLLGALPIRIPEAEIQGRVVDLVESVDGYIDALRAQADAARTARTSLLYHQLNAGGDGWEETTLGAVATFAGGSAFPRRYQGVRTAEVPFVKVSDMNRAGNEVRIETVENYVDRATLSEMRAKSWPEGTVVFPKVGAALLTEKRRILGRECAIDNNCLGLIASDRIEPYFLLYFMETVVLGEFAQHGAVPSVNQGHISTIPLALPPLGEQNDICERIQAVDETVHRLVQTESAATELRAALLSDLLSGDHEIPESYDALLEAS